MLTDSDDDDDDDDDALPFSRRVFILGPSHHVHLTCCALSSAEIYRTPLYDMRIDQKGMAHFYMPRERLSACAAKAVHAKLDCCLPVYAELWKTGLFDRMNIKTDEDEHSIEMHLPYTAKAMER